MRKGFFISAILVFLMSAGATVASKPPAHSLTICHATGSATNPYVEITVDVAAVIHGHSRHDGDIYPPFSYDNTTYTGSNWPSRTAIYSNGCLESTPTPTPAPSASVTVTTVVTPATPAPSAEVLSATLPPTDSVSFEESNDTPIFGIMVLLVLISLASFKFSFR